jgi:methylglutaconyl-CoA hydratase
MENLQQATKYEVRDRAAWITLDSPENRNALSVTLVTELAAHLHAAVEDPKARVVVLTGNGPAFCAGADLKSGGGVAQPGSGGKPFVEILKLIREGPKPVVCGVNGHAFGGGIGLVAAADIAIAVDTAKFSFSEVRIGVVPAMISVVVLPKLGEHNTMRLFLTAERFTAKDALGYGLLHRVVPVDDLQSAVQAEIDAIARGGPIAIAEAKRLVRLVARLPMDQAFAYAEERIAALFASEEAAEGMMAFVSRRPPSWVEDVGD